MATARSLDVKSKATTIRPGHGADERTMTEVSRRTVQERDRRSTLIVPLGAEDSHVKPCVSPPCHLFD